MTKGTYHTIYTRDDKGTWHTHFGSYDMTDIEYEFEDLVYGSAQLRRKEIKILASSGRQEDIDATLAHLNATK